MKKRLLMLSGLVLLLFTSACEISITKLGVSISPTEVAMAPGSTREFKATVTGASDPRVTWVTPAGSSASISADTLTATFTAPTIEGTYELVARTVVGTPQAEAKATITVDPFATAKRVTASSDTSTPVDSAGIVNASQATYFQVEVPADFKTFSGADADLVYFELCVKDGAGVCDQNSDKDLTLTLFNSLKQAQRESNTKSLFGTIDNGLLSNSLSTQGINVGITCRGPCAIAEAPEDASQTYTLFVKVETASTENVEFELYAFADVFQDETEPANNDCSDIPNQSISTTAIIVEPTPETPLARYNGAIEAVEDRDCFNSGNATITKVTLETNKNFSDGEVNADNKGIEMKAIIYVDGVSQAELIVNPANPTAFATLNGNSTIDVIVTSNNGRAGPALNSQYILSLE